MRFPLSFAAVLLLVLPVSSPAYETAVPTVRFASKDAAEKVVTDDSADPYFSRLKPLEIALKTSEGMPKEIKTPIAEIARGRYAKLTREFTGEEENALRFHTAKIDAVCADYPVYLAIPWCFVKVSDKLEGGLPHTRGKFIILGEGFLRTVAAEKEGMRALQLEQVIAHEKVHVHQRLNPGFYDTLYTKVWPWKKAGKLELPASVTDREVHNPDGVLAEWVLPGMADRQETFLLPLILINPDAKRLVMPQAMEMEALLVKKDGSGLAFDPDKNGKPQLEKISESKEFQTAFPTSESRYHPNEVAADVFSTLLLLDHLFPESVRKTPEAAKVAASLDKERAWFQAHYGPKTKAE